MPSSLPEIKVRFTDAASLGRVKARAEQTGVSVAAFLLLCAGEPYPEHGGKREPKAVVLTAAQEKTLAKLRAELLAAEQSVAQSEREQLNRQKRINIARRKIKAVEAGRPVKDWTYMSI